MLKEKRLSLCNPSKQAIYVQSSSNCTVMHFNIKHTNLDLQSLSSSSWTFLPFLCGLQGSGLNPGKTVLNDLAFFPPIF